MTRHLLAAVMTGALAFAAPAFAADTYTFDKGHTRIGFSWNHMGMSTQQARFASFDGEVVFDAEKPENSKVTLTIDPASVDSGVTKLDEHFKSEDFFNVAANPKITFTSTSVRKTGTRFFQIAGNLTIKGRTLPVTLDATLNHNGDHPLAGFVKAYAGMNWQGWSARTNVSRTAFDLGKYVPLTNDTIEIAIEAELKQKK